MDSIGISYNVRGHFEFLDPQVNTIKEGHFLFNFFLTKPTSQKWKKNPR